MKRRVFSLFVTTAVVGMFAFLAFVTTAAPRAPAAMSWFQDFRSEGMPFVVRTDHYRNGRYMLLLSAGPTDRTPQHAGCNLLNALGMPHTVGAAVALHRAPPVVADRIIEQRARLRKALGFKSDSTFP